MGAIFVSKSNTKAVTTAAAILCCLALPALANTDPVSQDKLAMNTGAPTSAYQDAEVKQAIDTIKAVDKQAGAKSTPIKTKIELRHNHKSAGNILILGGAEAFPM